VDDERPVEREIEAAPGCLTYGLFLIVALWTVGVSVLAQGGVWLAAQIAIIQDEPFAPVTWATASWVEALLLAVPLVLLARYTRASALRTAYTTWALAAGLVAGFGLVRLLPTSWTDGASLAQTALGVVGVAMLLRLGRSRGYAPSLDRWGASAVPLAVAAVVAAPFFAFGALGSPLDTVLAIFAGLSFGALAATLLDTALFDPARRASTVAGSNAWFGGLCAAVALLVLGSGFGFAGGQLLLMGALAPLGFAAAAIARPANPGEPSVGARRPLTTLLGLAAVAPLALFDPNQLTLILGDNEVPTWAARAVLYSALLGLALGFALLALRPWPWTTRRRSLTVGLAAIPWVAVLALYAFVGQPGFYGNHIFVILKDQADVSPARTISDGAERTRYVYETLTRSAASTQAGLRSGLGRFGIRYTPYYLVNGIDVEGGPLVRLIISGRPEVDRILDSPRLRPLPTAPPPAVGDRPAPSGPDWNVTSIGADRVWRDFGATGQGIVVGISDSGVDGDHPALRDGYRGRLTGDSYNWLDPWNGTTAPTDSDGHGTHTTGSVLGRGGIGVAPGAEWFGCVNLARNLGNPADYLECMQFMLAPYPHGGDAFRDGNPSRAAMVTNNSWGCPPEEGCDPTSLEPAVAALRDAGIFVVTSAGNSGPRCGSVSDPIAIYQDAFTVGAEDRRGNVAEFSSRGPVEVDGSGRVKPNILAPGVDVLSSFPGGTYQIESGTSMAGPHVVGVVALMWSAQPKLIGDVDKTEQILLATADPYDGQQVGCFDGSPHDAVGAGSVDAYAAVQAARDLR
jgi:subtilisin family serine protease